ncbi:hypothetical protein JTB14_007160 [Gonioctena quinquepunctata]|nr:hypothetical protein JTB14_007160 [Gonioctena quinquepunctata]
MEQLYVNNNRSNFEKKIKDYESRIIPNLGDNGEPSYLDGNDAREGERALKTFALNTILSDRMPLNRKLRDPRNKKCKKFEYNPKLRTSVIVIFYNELMSVILRTVWSVILQTPSHLLEEIILVDDASTDENLKGLLDHYIETRLKNYSINLVRLKHRLGLIRARLQGARVAQGDVLIFLDAHCEATVGWAEPLLSRIEDESTAVLVPIIDVIEATNLAYSTNGDSSFQVGGFSWSGHFTWIDIQNEEDKHKLTPVKSPTMAGGLFAIDRKFFWDIGSYDEQMDGWGGENLEMSFRIWQCGGRLETGDIEKSFQKLKFEIQEEDYRLQVLPSKLPNKPVLVRFNSAELRQRALDLHKSKKKLDTEKCGITGERRIIYFNEDLPKDTRILFQKARELN